MIQKKVLVESPGRINLIGEHIDYNGGKVLPAAIKNKIIFQLESIQGVKCYIQSKTIDKSFIININSLEKSETHWENYIIGVLKNLIKKRKLLINGFKCLIDGDLPIGAGISSSSSLICGFIKGLDKLNNLNLTNNDIIDIAREVEHNFIGLTGGIMDQSTILNGKKNKVLLIDCKNRSFDFIDSDFGRYKFLLLNTNIEHKLSDSLYNKRVGECGSALNEIKSRYKKVNYLCDVSLKILNEFKGTMDEVVFNRAQFVIQEHERVLNSVKKIKESKFKEFGMLMYESHYGLKELYEVSCQHLDFMVDISKNYEHVLGSRMMGGGFGGCTINLIHSDFIDSYIDLVSKEYYNKFSIHLSPIVTEISDGITCSEI